MGCCLGCLICDCACCAAKGVFKGCSKAIEAVDHRGGRISNAILFFLVAVVCWVFRMWGYQIFKGWKGSAILDCGGDVACFSALSVFRLTFVLAIFHILMGLLTIGISSQKDWRMPVQNGWWLLKIIFLIGFFIGWIALGAGALFLLVQLVFLVDFAHSWAENWIDKNENASEGDRRWWILMLGTTFFFYGLVLLASILVRSTFRYSHFSQMGVFYGKGGCDRNIAVIIVNVILCIIMSLISIHPKVQEANPKSGILQSSIISVYVTYLVLSSMMSSSDSCNPWYNSTGSYHISMLIGVLFTILSICLATYNAASKFERDLESASKSPENDTKEAIFHFSKFHAIFFLGALYLAMLMTDWRTFSNPGHQTARVDSGPAAVWVKTATSWACVLLYIWTLVGPVLFPNRDWFPKKE